MSQTFTIESFKITWTLKPHPPGYDPCRTYWGSHGCERARGHDGHHWCCCDCVMHPDDDSGCVGTWPYYGANTKFYGEDAPTPTH